ncbi:MAG: metal-dependent hydrolase [candidate division KSB1 bacterium]|nr:metal-dependent hydrolase [candidate division KSB1 bacterium]MDZ7275994.1 metal-dependent hydrolase [candidate division KSB1 bacterium]MDZ7285724.1 metal-dependent hydrolase [candidate division KSB1 bacterium]MDZ7298756.1 metal-dependent hydrolase [candidate division KSB1 bacterium]MDZ7305939.1 metal-dependent hydrolase [candidate division KSB1 bacterium]
MPLPIAHSLMGYTLAESSRLRLTKSFWLDVLILMALANLPDIDFLPGYLMGRPNLYHHYYTHSVTFAALVAALLALCFWRRRGRFWPCFALVFAAVGSHLALDLVTVDQAPPYGMALWWPFTSQFYDVGWEVFGAVHKSDVSHDFFASLFHPANLRVVVIELLVMLPIAAFVRGLRCYSDSRGKAPARRLAAASAPTRRSLSETPVLPGWQATRPRDTEENPARRAAESLELLNLDQPEPRNGHRH